MTQIQGGTSISSLPDFNGSYVAPDGTQYSGTKVGNTFRGSIMSPKGQAFSGDINGSSFTGSGTPPQLASTATSGPATSTDSTTFSPLATSQSTNPSSHGAPENPVLPPFINPLIFMVDR